MADYSGISAAGRVSAGNDGDTLSTLRKRMQSAIDAYADTRQDELEDLKFYAGDSDNQFQWPSDVLATRGAVQGQTINARPCLTINKLPQHVRAVTNDQRQNRPAGKVIPVDDKADVAVAEVLNGVVRHIEYMSDADVAYDSACENQVTFGEGYIRICTDYVDADSFDQDIKIVRVRNPFSIYMDPMIQCPTGSDAEWCIITEDLSRDEYERTYPDASPANSLLSLGVGDQSLYQLITENSVRIVEYFYVEYEKVKINLYPGNVTVQEGSPEDEAYKLHFGKPSRSRSAQKRKICWLKSNGYEILEKGEWAGKYIPVVRVVGNEFEIDGRIYLSGLVRNAKDAQRMYNYHASTEVEFLALSPKAPFIGYGGQFEGYEDKWKTANTQNFPYLEVNPDVTDAQGNMLPLPQRASPPMASSGILQAKAGASEDIKSTTGQYDASLGMVSNERSGKAIMARQRQGDVGTYHFVDNLARAVRQVTRQLVDLIPKIYDTERVARIIGEDGETSMVQMNPNQTMPVNRITDQNGVEIEKIYNPSIGTYDVVVTTGPGYATKRQEALDGMSQLLQGNPQLWAAAGDLFVKNMDWPGAQEMAERLKKTIDPKLLSDDDPALMAAQNQIEQMGQQMQQMQQMLMNIGQSMQARELELKEQETRIKAFDAETKRLSALQSGLTPDQVNDIVEGTIHGMVTSQDIQNEFDELEMMNPTQLPSHEQEAAQRRGVHQMPNGGTMPNNQMPPEGAY